MLKKNFPSPFSTRKLPFQHITRLLNFFQVKFIQLEITTAHIMACDQRKILIIGGRGALGQILVQHFKQKQAWVVSVDHSPNPAADLNIITANNKTTTEQANLIQDELNKVLGEPGKVLDGIISVAGGWTAGNILEDDFLQSVELMWRQSVDSSVVASYLAGKYLKEMGLVVMTGAEAALKPTPSMIAYGIAKAAVHHLIRSLGKEGSGLPKDAVVVGLLPRTLDTPNNRKFASDATNFGSWTPLNHVSGLIEDWMEAAGNPKPQSGNLLEVVTLNGETTVKIH